MTEKELCNKYDWYEPHQKWLRGDEGGKRANLTHADLGRANLFDANLFGAKLIGANLNGADLTRANLEGAKITGSIIDGRWVPPSESNTEVTSDD